MALRCTFFVAFAICSSASHLAHIKQPRDVLRALEVVQEKASPEEKAKLRAMLEEHVHGIQVSHKAAPLLEDILGRGRGRRLADCSDMVNESTCSACGHCEWSGWCQSPRCDDYTNQSSCCANPKRVAEGCYWDSSSSECVDNSCSARSSAQCTDGTWNCNEARTWCEAQAACILDAQSGMCSTNIGNAAMGLVNVLTCPLMDCSMCLKQIQTAAGRWAAVQGSCSAKCSQMVHCESEVECLMAGSDPSCEVDTPQPSCTTAVPTPSPTPVATCEMTCQAFETQCSEQAKSCGATSSAVCRNTGDANGAEQSSLALPAMILICWFGFRMK